MMQPEEDIRRFWLCLVLAFGHAKAQDDTGSCERFSVMITCLGWVLCDHECEKRLSPLLKASNGPDTVPDRASLDYMVN